MTMFTEQSLRHYPTLVKAFTGVEDEAFWEIVVQMEAQLPAQERQRLQRPDRQRALGGGRLCERPLAERVALVLSYLRLHVSQCVPRGGWPLMGHRPNHRLARVAT